MGKRAEILGWYRLCRAMGLPRIYSVHTAFLARSRIEIAAALVPEPELPDPDHLVVDPDYIDTQREQAGLQ